MILSFCVLGTTSVYSQNGDQILDGIGETDLSARYILSGDLNDWSRNNLHATIEGSGFSFVEDDLFGEVLSLSGDTEAVISIPGESVTGLESLSIAGWIYLRSDERGQIFFDFGRDNQTHFLAAPAGTNEEEGYQVQILTESQKFTASSSAVELDEWNHLAVVINVPARTLSSYINGMLVSEARNVDLELEQLFDINQGGNNRLYIGKPQASDNTYLNAKLHDFRIYRIPLSRTQILGIHANALDLEEPVVRTREETDPSLPYFPETTPQLYNVFITNVPDIQVETVVGHLPRLPRLVPAVYAENIDRSKARVIWPAPEDNSDVLSPGTYTITGSVPGTNLQPRAIVTVLEDEAPASPERNLEDFEFGQVILNTDIHDNNTKFKENRDKFITVLSGTNPDDFLYMFRNAFGQEQPEGAQALGGWDSQQTKLRGHATGHYLTAIAQSYASSTYDPELQAIFADKMEYLVNTLYDLSQLSGRPRTHGGEYVSDPTAVPPGPGRSEYDSDLSEEGIRTDYWNWGVGYISAYPPDQFIMLEHGATYGGADTSIWAPYYTLDKILAGLMDIYEITGNEKALEIVKGMGSWVHARLDELPTRTLISMWNRYIAGEYGGMNDAMARLYRLTNEPTYLEAAKLFDNIRMFFGDADRSHGLAKNVDMFRGLHSNTHVPQVIGALETYRVTGAPEYFHIADNFFYRSIFDYMYSIGGVAGARNPSNAECYTAEPSTKYQYGFSPGGQNETCATYNMLKLAKGLFMFDQRGEFMDYYERGLYNHILASVAEDSPANTYHVPLLPGSIKRFGNPEMRGFTCCNGTAIESSTKLHYSIYFRCKEHQNLYVNLYVPSTLNWTERNVTVTQETAFPREDHTRLIIEGNGEFDLNVRVPHWATEGFYVSINGREENVEAVPGSYLTLSRNWQNGDTVELRMPFQFHLDPVMDQQNIASLFYGPVLLAAQESEPLTEWREVTLDAEDISRSISGNPEQLEFNIDGVVFKPFYDTYGRHSVYLNVTLE